VVVVGLLCAGGAWWGAGAAWEWGVNWGHEQATGYVRDSQLPPEQVESILADLERARRAALDGRIDYGRLETLEDEIARVGSMGLVQAFEARVLGSTELPPQEMDEAVRAVQRLARGIQEGDIHPREIPAIDLEVGHDGRLEAWDVEDVRAVVRKARRAADDAGVPDEPFQVDLAARFAEVIDGLIE
jgi:hypothetical protein